MKKKTMSLREANTFDEICSLQRDNFDVKDYWLTADECEVSLAEQKIGNPATQLINIPRAVFNKLIDKYMRQQKTS